ncbi:MAG TPA: type II secretion system protein [Candidatus Paceibacterota bacterium]|nr:type II secretion system protein [Candidatus Paceibacterota bacterium]
MVTPSLKQKVLRKLGFSLVELLIVLSIFSIMTALLVANYRRFGNNVTLTNLVYEVALSIREVQSFGLGVRSSGSGSTATQFNQGYGFNIANNSSYRVFADEDASKTFNAANPLDVTVRVYTLPTGNTISKKCGTLTVGGAYANIAGNLDITFLRPDPAAVIRSGATDYKKANICLQSANSRVKQIEVTNAGQISVADGCVCP